MKRKCLLLAIALFTIPLSLSAADRVTDLNAKSFKLLTGLETNQFGTVPEKQLGSVMIVRGRAFVEELSHRTGHELKGNVVIQVTGALAEYLKSSLKEMSDGVISLGEGVVYLTGSLAEGLADVARQIYSGASDMVLEGVSFLISTGSDAATLIDSFVSEMGSRMEQGMNDLGSAMCSSYADARDWTIKALHLGFEFGAGGTIVWNPVSLYGHALDGVDKIAAKSGDAILYVATGLGSLFSYISGQDNTSLGTALSRTGAVVGEAGYSALYAVSDLARGAKDLLNNPFTSITLVSETASKLLGAAGKLTENGYDIVTGFVTRSLKDAAALMEAHSIPLGGLVAVVGDTVEGLADLGKGAMAVFQNVGEGVWNRVVGLFDPSSSLDTMQKFFEDAGEAISSFAQDVWDFIKHPFGIGK